MIPGMMLGIQVGKRAIFLFEEAGSADLLVSVAYVSLLGLVGIFSLWDARSNSNRCNEIGLAVRVEAIQLPPRVTLVGNRKVSVWVVLVVGGVIGMLSGFLGVGGGFLLMPAMMYGLGIPATIAVGTGLVQITVSGAYGTFIYADAGAVALPTVASLLAGSAFGARIGAGATKLVDENDLKRYFAAMLLAGSVSVAATEVSDYLGLEALNVASIVLIFGVPVLISAAITFAAVSGRHPRDSERATRLHRRG